MHGIPKPPRNARLGQYFTPAWAAEALIEREFGWLRAGDLVVEPSCGDGAFLCALPSHVDAVGVEIDPAQAERARQLSGRRVITGDFLTVDVAAPGSVSAVVGNPPFMATFFEGMLERAADLLKVGGVLGAIVPVYFYQTSSSVERYARSFDISHSLLPRNLFPGLSLPLGWTRMRKMDRPGRLSGFMLYAEAQQMRQLKKELQAALSERRNRRGVWATVVEDVLRALGGQAKLREIYRAMASKLPTANPEWQAQVRKVLNTNPGFVRVAAGEYRAV